MDAFVKTRELPDKLTHGFIQAVQEVLASLVKIEVRLEELREAFLAGGSLATMEELKARFDTFLEALAKGKEVGKIRLVLK